MQSSGQPFDLVRVNFAAIHVATGCGITPGWNYITSVGRGEASPGTDVKPARKYWTRPNGNTSQWVRAAITYTGELPTKYVFHYSADNEATYVPMEDVDGNYVLTLAYNGTIIKQTTWGRTP
jgi:hypothetical protein